MTLFQSQRPDVPQKTATKKGYPYYFSRFLSLVKYVHLHIHDIKYVHFLFKGIYALGFHGVSVGCNNGATALTGFSHKKMYGRLPGTK